MPFSSSSLPSLPSLAPLPPARFPPTRSLLRRSGLNADSARLTGDPANKGRPRTSTRPSRSTLQAYPRSPPLARLRATLLRAQERNALLQQKSSYAGARLPARVAASPQA